MGKVRLLYVLFLQVFIHTVIAQRVPHIDGELHLSVKTGSVSGKFYLSNLPDLGKSYALLLNRGLNLHLLKDSSNQVLFPLG